MGRGLSKLQKEILSYAKQNGGVRAPDAIGILFRLLPKEKREMKETSSVHQHCGNRCRRHRGRRTLTPSEKRDAAVAASASRALTRLLKRGLLVWIPGRLINNGSRTSNGLHETTTWIEPVYVLSDSYWLMPSHHETELTDRVDDSLSVSSVRQVDSANQ